LSREDVRQLFRFIDWMMDLPPALEKLFWQEIDRFQEETPMPYMMRIERILLAEALLEGIELGLELKFGAAGLQLMPEIKQLTDVEMLRGVLQAIKTAASPDELRRLWVP
jgi:hypothetical protein